VFRSLALPRYVDTRVWCRVVGDELAIVAKTKTGAVEIGQSVDVRADSVLVKVFHRGQLIKTHPRQLPGGRSTDREDLPGHKNVYALRDLDRLVAAARRHGDNVGIYASRLSRVRCRGARCAPSTGYLAWAVAGARIRWSHLVVASDKLIKALPGMTFWIGATFMSTMVAGALVVRSRSPLCQGGCARSPPGTLPMGSRM
jgi:hypothetical protein